MEPKDKIHHEILQELQHLSFSALKEVKLFIDFLIIREKNAIRDLHVEIDQDLKSMCANETNHLEDEFFNYQDIYPRTTEYNLFRP